MLRRALRHRSFRFGGAVLAAVALVSLAAPLLTPYDPTVQNLSERLVEPFWAPVQELISADIAFRAVAIQV